MRSKSKLSNLDPILVFSSALLIVISIVVLRSIAPSIFPSYFLFIGLGLLAFLFFVQIDFEIYSSFSWHLYFLSIFLLLLPLAIGQVTRGSIRWIPLGQLTIQPSELVRPFLLVFFANYLVGKDLTVERLVKVLFFLALPLFLILIQPSLGVMILTFVGFIGVFLASSVKKKYLLVLMGVLLVFAPVMWKLLAPYQQQRIVSFSNPEADPSGAGYNSIQSMISVGSGEFIGRGLGKGVQTQLAFLPEKHTDFIFAATAEELGFVGGSLLLMGVFVILWRIAKVAENSKGPVERAFVSGVFLVLFFESIVHIGMNMGLFPITGVPLPLVSAGGSAFLSTMISFAMVLNTKKTV